MMTQLKKSKWVTVKLLLALPLVAALLFANGTQAQTDSPKSAKAEKVTEVKEAQKTLTSQPTQKVAADPATDTKKEANQAEEKAIDKPEVQPEFPGGMEALYAYLAKNLKYSDEAKKNEVQGNVLISFIIEKNGKISHAKITANGLKGKENTPESVINDCALEALKVIKGMPDWKPGMNKGKPVRANFAIPIRFALH
jgi:periplasmic protein TonB